MNRVWLGVLCLIWSGVGELRSAQAGDRRVALLVGHQQGWKGEEFLQHTMTGDLNPLKAALQSVGFEVMVVANQGPDRLRKVFQRIALQHMDTFLFYYSGHAGPKAFHLGPQQQGVRPFGYDEFRWYLGQRIQSARRIAIIDACFGSRLLRLFKKSPMRIKGPRRQVRKNLIQVLQPMVGKTRGVQVIVSSQIHAFEDRSRKASIFTYYLLQGIRGSRSADADQDGVITVAEMFRYAGRRFQQETGEEPAFFDYTIKGVSPYGLIPAYNSYLRVHPRITGRLVVSVGNFVWVHFKRQGSAYRIRVVSGSGKVYWQQKKRCYVQDLTFAKGRDVSLTDRWKKTVCYTRQLQRKGLVLQARTEQLSPTTGIWSLSLLPGYHTSRSDIRASHSFSVDLGLRWRERLGFALQLLRGATHNVIASEGAWLDFTQLALRLELGYPFPFARIFRFWLGGYVLAGIFMQHSPLGDAFAFVLGGGLQLQLAIRVHRYLDLLFLQRTGIQWLAITQGHGISLQVHAAAGVAFHF